MGKAVTKQQVENIKSLKAHYANWIWDNWDYDKKSPAQKQADMNKEFPDRVTGEKNYAGMIYTLRTRMNADYNVYSYNDTKPEKDVKPNEKNISEFAQKRIALYAAAKETLGRRPWWRYLIHPIDSYNENKELNDLKSEITSLYGISDKTLSDLTDIALHPDKAENQNICFDNDGSAATEYADADFEEKAKEAKPILPSKEAKYDKEGCMVFDDEEEEKEKTLAEKQADLNKILSQDTSSELAQGKKSQAVTQNEAKLEKEVIDLE